MHAFLTIPAMANAPLHVDEVGVVTAVGRYQGITPVGGAGFVVNQTYLVMSGPAHEFVS